MITSFSGQVRKLRRRVEVLFGGQDLLVMHDFVYMPTTKGFERVDAIYRRIDDDYFQGWRYRETQGRSSCPGSFNLNYFFTFPGPIHSVISGFIIPG